MRGPELARSPGHGLLLLRLTVGVVFIMHGAQKLFTYGVGTVGENFASMGMPAASLAAWALSLAEFLGGGALVLGLFTRIAAALLAFVMVMAFALVHAPHGFFLPEGFEYVLTLFAANAALVLGGPGVLAVDNVLRRRRAPELRAEERERMRRAA